MPENTSPKVLFLLGAGASVAAGIPAVKRMTSDFLNTLPLPLQTLATDIFEQLNSRNLENQSPGEPDIEDLLFLLNQLLLFSQNPISSFAAVKHKYSTTKLRELKLALETYIRRSVISPKDVAYLGPILSDRWLSAIHIFSVNYDTCIELLCRKHGRPLTDGFTPEWAPRSLNPENAPENSIFLYKLHGSALWYKSTGGWYVKIPIGVTKDTNEELPLYDGEVAVPALLYPMYKQPQESPLLDFIYTFKRYLENASFLIVIGYSFRDDYLNRLLRDALMANPELHIFTIAPDSRNSYAKLLNDQDKSFRLAFERRVSCFPFAAENFLERFKQNFPSTSSAVQGFRAASKAALTGEHPNWDGVAISLANSWEPDLSIRALESLGSLRKFHDSSQLLSICIANYCLAMAQKDTELIGRAKSYLNNVCETIWKSIAVRFKREGQTVSLYYNLISHTGSISGTNGISRACVESLDTIYNVATSMLRDDVPDDMFEELISNLQDIEVFFGKLGQRDHYEISQFCELFPSHPKMKAEILELLSDKNAQQIERIPSTPLSKIGGYPPPKFMTF